MRGLDTRSGELFSYVDLEQRVPANHPLARDPADRERYAGQARSRVRQDLLPCSAGIDPAGTAAPGPLLQAFSRSGRSAS